MTSIFSALSAKIFGGLAIAIALFAAWQTIQLSAARSANSSLTEQLSTAKAEKALCSLSVSNMKALADERGKRADLAVEIARKETVVHVDAARDILSIPTPTPDKECTATLQLLKDHQ